MVNRMSVFAKKTSRLLLTPDTLCSPKADSFYIEKSIGKFSDTKSHMVNITYAFKPIQNVIYLIAVSNSNISRRYNMIT
jgi:hypothetical protein